jgi:hypothetical protein
MEKTNDVKKWVTIGLVTIAIVMLVKYALKIINKGKSSNEYTN